SALQRTCPRLRRTRRRRCARSAWGGAHCRGGLTTTVERALQQLHGDQCGGADEDPPSNLDGERRVLVARETIGVTPRSLQREEPLAAASFVARRAPIE